LDAPYYDFPARNAQELIEYLGLDFTNGNILKSLVREYGPTTKKTTALYEAEKRYYYAHRHLLRVQEAWAGGGGCLPDAEKGLEETAEE
jgi:hypothetical protein